MTISDNVKLVRKKLHLTQEDFGNKLGVTRGVIYNIEKNLVEPKMLFLEHLCQVYKVNPDWLLHGEGDMFMDSPEDKAEDELSAFFADVMLDKKPDECIDLLRVLATVKDDEWKFLGPLVDRFAYLRKMRKEKDDQ